MKRRRKWGIGLLLGLSVLWGACQKAPEKTTQQAGDEQPPTTSSEAAPPATTSVTIPGGTEIRVRLLDSLGSATSRAGDNFQANLDAPMVVDSWVAVPKGAKVIGRVTSAQPSGHLQTPAELALTLTSIEIGGYMYQINTSNYVSRAKSHTKRNAAWIGGGAAGGALLGALIGKGKGAAIGAGVGAGGGTATAYATGKKDIVLPSETRLSFRLKQSLTVTRAA